MSSLNFKVFSTPFNRGGHPWIFAWLILMAGVVLLGLAGKESLPWAFNLPRPWHIPLRYWISDFMKWLLNDFDLGPQNFDFGPGILSFGLKNMLLTKKKEILYRAAF